MSACCSKPTVQDSPELIAERREQRLKSAEKRQKESEERGVKTQKMKNKLKTNASISAAPTTRGGVGLNEG